MHGEDEQICHGSQIRITFEVWNVEVEPEFLDDLKAGSRHAR
jgi:hypothetical protein